MQLGHVGWRAEIERFIGERIREEFWRLLESIGRALASAGPRGEPA